MLDKATQNIGSVLASRLGPFDTAWCRMLVHSLEEANSVGDLLSLHCEQGAAILSSTNRNRQHFASRAGSQR